MRYFLRDRREKSSKKESRRIGPGPRVDANGSFGCRPTCQPWELVIAGDLTEQQYDLLNQLVEVGPRSHGVIYFDSCGGSAYAGLALASLIRMRQLSVTGVVAGECSSAALLPFAACARRCVTRHSTLLFHPIRWQSEERVRLEEAAEWTRHFRLMEADHDQLLADLFGTSIDLLRNWSYPGRFVMGEEFASHGLAELIDMGESNMWQVLSRRA